MLNILSIKVYFFKTYPVDIYQNKNSFSRLLATACFHYCNQRSPMPHPNTTTWRRDTNTQNKKHSEGNNACMAPTWSQLRTKLGLVDRCRIAVKAGWGIHPVRRSRSSGLGRAQGWQPQEALKWQGWNTHCSLPGGKLHQELCI